MSRLVVSRKCQILVSDHMKIAPNQPPYTYLGLTLSVLEWRLNLQVYIIFEMWAVNTSTHLNPSIIFQLDRREVVSRTTTMRWVTNSRFCAEKDANRPLNVSLETREHRYSSSCCFEHDCSLWPDMRFYPYKLTKNILQQKLTVHAKRTRPDENVPHLCYLLLFQECKIILFHKHVLMKWVISKKAVWINSQKWEFRIYRLF